MILLHVATYWRLLYIVKQIAAVIVKWTSTHKRVLCHEGDFFWSNSTDRAVHLAFGTWRYLQTALRGRNGNCRSALTSKVATCLVLLLLLVSCLTTFRIGVQRVKFGGNAQFCATIDTLLERYFFVISVNRALIFPVDRKIYHSNQLRSLVTHCEQLDIAEDKIAGSVVTFFFLTGCVWKVPAKVSFCWLRILKSASFAWRLNFWGWSQDSAPNSIQFNLQLFVFEVCNSGGLIDALRRSGCGLGVVAGDYESQVDIGRNLQFQPVDSHFELFL